MHVWSEIKMYVQLVRERIEEEEEEEEEKAQARGEGQTRGMHDTSK